jgi:cytochrome P450
MAEPFISLLDPRYATGDLEFAGVSIGKGDVLTCSLQSAVYDESVFPDPERCDVEREPKPGEGQIGFGVGPTAASARLWPPSRAR